MAGQPYRPDAIYRMADDETSCLEESISVWNPLVTKLRFPLSLQRHSTIAVNAINQKPERLRASVALTPNAKRFKFKLGSTSEIQTLKFKV